MATREDLLKALPFVRGDLAIREWTRRDLDLLASWPAYPFPYEGFEFSFARMDPSERDELFRSRQGESDAITLVVDHARQPAIGYLAPRSVDWRSGTVGNLGLRVHPAWCSRGVGTSILRHVTRWSLEHGVTLWRLEVAASNGRAIRCYEKAGFVRTGETWRQASDLCGVDLDEPRYAFVRPHVRRQGGRVELRFLVMEPKGEHCP